MRNISGRILFILLIIVGTALKIKETDLSLYTGACISVELKGYLPYDQTVKLKKGSSYQDLINEAQLYEDCDLSLFSFDYPLYDGQIIEFKKKDSSLININTADKAELIKLPGIGEKTAEKIIEYRDKIPFHCKEDLLKINGIGEKKYEILKELISV